MSLWIWILLLPLLVVAFAHADSWLASYTSYVRPQHHRGAKTGMLIIYLPGILADGEVSSRTVMQTWRKYGDVISFSYTGDRFDADDVILAVMRYLRTDTQHDKFVFIGSSMGGLLSVDILNQMKHEGNTSLFNASRIIAVDSPSGSKDMKGGGNIVAPILRFLPFGLILDSIVTAALHAGAVPPKPTNIEPHLDKEQTREEALRMMKQFSAAVWRDQLAYMAGHRHPDLAGFNPIVYLRCDHDNETVKQPQASKAWESAAPDLTIIGVDSTHCGYLERPVTWNERFDQTLKLVSASF